MSWIRHINKRIEINFGALIDRRGRERERERALNSIDFSLSVFIWSIMRWLCLALNTRNHGDMQAHRTGMHCEVWNLWAAGWVVAEIRWFICLYTMGYVSRAGWRRCHLTPAMYSRSVPDCTIELIGSGHMVQGNSRFVGCKRRKPMDVACMHACVLPWL